MNFKLYIYGEKSDSMDRVGYAHIRNRSLGLLDVDRIREEAKCNLPLDRISEYTDAEYFSEISPSSTDALVIYISEEDARKTGLFLTSCKEEIVVPEDGLNKYKKETVIFKRKEDTGEIIKGLIELSIDREKIVSDWLADGAPLRWMFDTEKDVSE